MSLFQNTYRNEVGNLLAQKEHVSDTVGVDIFLEIIISISIVFALGSLLMTVYMVYHRKNMIKNKISEHSLISKYQLFLSSFLLLPNDPVFLNISKSDSIIERLDPSDLNDTYKRSILAQEIYNLHEQLDGQQAIQLNNYFFGLGLQSDIIDKIKSENWTDIVKAMQFIRAFNIQEALIYTDKMISNKNRAISIHAICIRICMDKNISVLEKIKHKLNHWEWHKILNEIKLNKLQEIDFTAIKHIQIQDLQSIEIIESELNTNTRHQHSLVDFT